MADQTAKYYETTAELAKELKKLNPKTTIYMWNKNVPQEGIFCDVPADKLKLPEGFYYNEKNGITNKHHTELAYNALTCKSIEKLNLEDEFIRNSVDEVKLPSKKKNSIVETIKKKVCSKKKTEISGLKR